MIRQNLQWQSWHKWNKLCIKFLAEINLFRQVSFLSKAISRYLSYCSAFLSEFQCFSSSEVYFTIFCPSVSPGTATDKVPVSGRSNQPLWVYHPASQTLGDLFFLLLERGDFAPLKSCAALCLFSNSEVKQLNFPLHNVNPLSLLNTSGLCILVCRPQRMSPSLTKTLVIPTIWLKLNREQSPS